LQADRYVWALEAVEASVHSDRAGEIDRLDLIVLLAEKAPDVRALAYLGAGPLDDYLAAEPDIARVEGAATRSDAFRTALTMAWFESSLGQQDTARLRRFGDPA
jgi:hypothetical protein